MASLRGLFFWRKDKQSESQKAEEMLQLYVKYYSSAKKDYAGGRI